MHPYGAAMTTFVVTQVYEALVHMRGVFSHCRAGFMLSGREKKERKLCAPNSSTVARLLGRLDGLGDGCVQGRFNFNILTTRAI